MSYKFSFADNTTYDAADINAITKRLVTSGIEDDFFVDGVAYNVSSFNEAGKLLYTSGAVPESCFSLKVENIGDDKILINPGKAFFNDGAVIEIELGGETLSYVSGSKNYVYLKNDLINTNRCYPCCALVEPDGDFVMLAEIDEKGVVTDKRTYAQGRLPGYQSVAGNVLVIDEKLTRTVETAGKTHTGSATFDIGNNNYEYILVMTPRPSTSYSYDPMPCLGVYDIKTGSYLGFHGSKYHDFSSGGTGGFSEGHLYSHYEDGGDKYIRLTFSISDGKLTVNYTYYTYNQYWNEGSTYSINIKLFLF